MLNRREFGKVTLAAAGMAVLTGACLPMMGCDSSWMSKATSIAKTIANSALPAIAKLVSGLASAGVITNSDLAVVSGVLTNAIADINVALSLIESYSSSVGSSSVSKIDAALDSVLVNLNGVLSMTTIKDSTVTTKISSVITLVVSEIEALLALIPSAVSSANNSKAMERARLRSKNMAADIKCLSLDEFRNAFNNMLHASTSSDAVNKVAWSVASI